MVSGCFFRSIQKYGSWAASEVLIWTHHLLRPLKRRYERPNATVSSQQHFPVLVMLDRYLIVGEQSRRIAWCKFVAARSKKGNAHRIGLTDVSLLGILCEPHVCIANANLTCNAW